MPDLRVPPHTAAQELEAALPESLRNNLSASEKRLLGAVPTDDFAYSDPQDSHVRAEFLRWLCTSPQAETRIDARGVRLEGATITGELNLSFLTVPFPLRLHSCTLPDSCDLQYLKIPLLDLGGSTLPGGMNADGLEARGDVFLRNCIARKLCRFIGARIGGDLSFDNATLDDDGGALNLNDAQIDGRVSLHRTDVAGGVSLTHAHIKGNLSADGATLRDAKVALNAEGATIDGAAFLRSFTAEGMDYPFSAEGEINESVTKVVAGFPACTPSAAPRMGTSPPSASSRTRGSDERRSPKIDFHLLFSLRVLSKCQLAGIVN